MDEKETKTNGEVDEEVQRLLDAKQVELGVSCEKQMRRTELNFYCEFYSQLKELNKELENLNNVINMVSTDKLADYFSKVTENYTAEEKKAKFKAKCAKSHAKTAKNAKTSK